MSIKKRITRRNRKYLLSQGDITAEYIIDKYCLRFKDTHSFISVRENSKYRAYKEAVNALKYLKRQDNY